MESKALKTDVCFNKNIYSEVFSEAVDADFTLPDYCPDISKIFKCKAVPTIISKSISGKSITIDGSVCITLFYCDKDNNFCSFEYLYPFNKIKEISEEGDDCNLSVSVKCDYINCRAVTGRKVDVHGAISVGVKVFKRCFNQIVSDYDGDSVQLKRSVAPATLPMGYREKQIIIEEEMRISNPQASILRILRYDAVPNIREQKVLRDKIVVKGEMAVTVLYMVEGIKIPQVFKTTLPFSQIVEMAGVTELCRCDVKAKISVLEIRPATSYGEDCKSFNFNAKLWLMCESYCVNDIAVIEDAYSTKYEADVMKNQVSFNKICENINETRHIKKNIELAENIASVIDIWCEQGSCKVKFENGHIVVLAILFVGMVVCDENDNISFAEKPVEFEFKHPLDCDNENLKFTPQIDILTLGYTITSANCVEVKIELCVSGAVYEKSDVSLVTDIKIDTSKPCCSLKKGGAVICFLRENENVWDIARRYNADVEDILKINNIENGRVENNKTIFVPIN